MTIRIAPSLLSADFASLATEIDDVVNAGADLLHLDIMDGHFVPNLTFGPPVVEALSRHSRVPLDAHLMVADADAYIDALASAGVARIAVHVEASVHLQRTLQRIGDSGLEAGIAINPATAASQLEDALPWADFVLVMSVNPGFGGQRFIPESLDKITRLRELASGRDLEIAVDGGVDNDNAAKLVRAGASTLIAGSAVFGCDDRRLAVERIREAAMKGLA